MEPTQRRGDDPAARFAVAGRNRLEMRTGMWHTGNNGATITTGYSGLDTFGGLGYTRYVREDLAVTVSLDALTIDSGASVGTQGVGAGTVGGWAVKRYSHHAYREETDACMRLRAAGYELLVTTEALAWHLLALGGGSRSVVKTARGVFVTSDRAG
jgi:hypothetical protein